MNAPVPPPGRLGRAAMTRRILDDPGVPESCALLDRIGACIRLTRHAVPGGGRLLDWEVPPGTLHYGECVIPGARAEEVLVSVACGGSGGMEDVAAAIRWAGALAARARRRFTWRILFAPGPLGVIAWLARNRDARARVRHGLVLGPLGQSGPFVWKRTRREDAAMDRIAAHALRHDAPDNRVLPFEPWGGNERHFGSPGFDLPVGRLSRVSPGGDAGGPGHVPRAFALLRHIEQAIEEDGRFRGTAQYGEPQLARRGLCPGATQDRALLWVLNQSDGTASLLDIAERARLPFAEVLVAARTAQQAGLLVPVGMDAPDGW